MDASNAPRLLPWSGLLSSLLIAAAASGQEAPPTVAWLERVEVASGEAYQGPWRMNKSRFRYVDDPTVAFDGAGSVGVAWVDQLWKDVFFQVYLPDGRRRFPKPTNVSRSAGVFSWQPRVVMDARDPSLVYVLWQEIVFSGGSHGGEIFFARSSDGGRRFERGLNLSNSRAGDGKGRLSRRRWHNGSLDLAPARDGTLYAAWTDYEGDLWLSRSTDGGKGFSRPSRIVKGRGAAPARAPSLAPGGGATVYLAWAVGEDPGADIHVARSDDGGRTFGPARVVCESPGHADAPRLALARDGTVHLVYGESPTGPLARYRILYTRSTDGGHRFAEPRVISDPMPEGFASASFPGLALDGQGSPYVLWELSPHPAAHPRGLGLTASSGAPPAFSAPALIPGSADPALGHNGGRQGLLLRKLAVHPEGGVAVVNSTFREGVGSHVWLFRGRRAPGDGATIDPRPSGRSRDGPSPGP
jgi:hypothetical protein